MTQPTLFDTPSIYTGSLCTPEEKTLAGLLNQHVGAHRAIQVKDAAAFCGIPTRKAQSIVNHLIHEHGAPIGTSMREPYGWYIAATPEEVAGVVALHRARALSELTTMARLKGIGLRQLLARIQTELEIDAA